MSAPRLTLSDDADARHVARTIGAAFKTKRAEQGDSLRDIMTMLDLSPGISTQLSRFERGLMPNARLNVIVRYLRLYRLTLVVAPIAQVNP